MILEMGQLGEIFSGHCGRGGGGAGAKNENRAKDNESARVNVESV